MLEARVDWSPSMTRKATILLTGLGTLLGLAVGASLCGAAKSDPPATLQEADSIATASRENGLVKATRIASPSVVGITVKSRELVRSRAADPMFQLFFGEPPAQLREAQSMGSGVVVDPKGFVVTNYHVVEAALESAMPAEIRVTFSNGRNLSGKLLGGDEDNDIAVVKVDGADLPVARTSRATPQIGEWALAIGNPFGYLIDDPRPTVTAGVISAVDRSFTPSAGISLRHVLQTDAAINPGNSGGALVNALGEVVGINTFIFTGGGQGSIGLGFAIPIQRALRIVEEIVRYGRVRDFQTGLATDPVAAAAMGLRRGDGVLISEVKNGSPGAKAGILPGDVVVAIDGRRVSDLEELRSVLRLARVGDKVPLRIRRAGSEIGATLVLEESSTGEKRAF
jgi:serine protease Do